MTLLNIHVASPDRVLVAVDTACAGAGETCHGSKLLTLPHANLVMASRGNLAFSGQLFAFLHAVPGFDIDAAMQWMPAAMAHGQRWLDGTVQVNAAVEDAGEQEVFLIGPSRYTGRLSVGFWRWRRGDGVIEAKEVDGNVSPAFEGATGELAHELGTIEAMLEVARTQVAEFRPQSPSFGGRLLLAEILAKPRPSITIRDVGDLS